MSASDLQALLRFLSQDAKVPLASAMGKVKQLQTANLDTPEKISKAKPNDIKSIFEDEKVAKQILAAAKRVTKKRATGGEDTTTSSPAKKRKKDGPLLFSDPDASPADIEASLALPSSSATEEELKETVLFTNRAPLALAFVFTLLKFSMPEQPLSSRLSLAQGYIGVTSKARALSLGIEKGRSAEEEGFGEGQPVVRITGKEVRVLRRWGYEWKKDSKEHGGDEVAKGDEGGEEQPPLWALDLEALKKSNTLDSAPALGRASGGDGGLTNLPIHTPQAARAYMLKAFDTAPSEQVETGKKRSGAAKVAEKERNLGKLLQALDILYRSWATALSPEDLDKRTWGWYVRVRPAVAEGAQGWGGKNTVKLADILALRREAT
ncbi:uncharacterized protein LTR77_005666 [Saxophila tyrrhenica]|uniref:Uncharacterized protein n=1 Tax=Saxophila tyrrhenica TaxID=1690608 RepID=A0AAV9P985_9PEZI|nr:hypothetical protein LTR77_005666 [Saxophila tyrrhenica]